MSWYSQTPAEQSQTPASSTTTSSVLTSQSYTEGSTARADSLEFLKLCQVLERAAKKSGSKKDKLDVIFTKKFQKLFGNQSIYPVLRLILPNLDTERIRYGIREKNLTKLMISANGWAPTHKKAVTIKGWKNAEVIGPMHGGDLASIISTVMADIMSTSRHLTVGQVNDLLDKLMNADGETAKSTVLQEIIQKMNALELKYLIRIVLKDMKLGFLHETVLKRLHEDALQQYNSHLDLRRLCAEIKDPSVRLTPKVTLWNKCTPMLCFKAESFLDSFSSFGDADFVIEDKLDGERLIVHFDRYRPIKLFSRNGVDIGEKYNYTRVLEPYLKKCVKVDRCILDGELLGYDSKRKRFTEFGENRTVTRDMCDVMDLGKEGDDVQQDGKWMCFIVFDILFVEGFNFNEHRVHDPKESSLTGLMLRERRAILNHCIRPWKNRIELINQLLVTDKDRKRREDILVKQLDRVILDHIEGLVLKNLSSPYILDGRKKEYWVKVKADYCDELNDGLDVIILAGYYGKGELRKGGISTFMLGVAKDPIDGGTPNEFFTIGKVGTGYSEIELKSLRAVLDKHEKPWNNKAPPPHIAGGWRPAKTDDIPDVWYPPEHSVILEVVGAEIVKSENWSSFFTIRFPRCRKIRMDKNWFDCLRYSQVQELFEKQKGGLQKTIGSSNLKSSPLKKRAIKAKAAMPPIGSVPAAFTKQVVRSADVKKESTIFKGQRCFVLNFALNDPVIYTANGREYLIKETRDVVELLVQNGATNFASMPSKKVIELIIAPPEKVPESSELHIFKTINTSDLLDIRYIMKCLDAGTIIKPVFEDFAFVSQLTREQHKDIYDEFGDHLTEAGTKRSLENVMQEVDISEATPEDFKRARTVLLHEEGEPLFVGGALLAGATLYIDKFLQWRTKESQSSEYSKSFRYSMLETVETLAMLLEADVSDILDDSVTHVIINPDMQNKGERLADLVGIMRGFSNRKSSYRHARVLNYMWVFEVMRKKSPWPYVENRLFFEVSQ